MKLSKLGRQRLWLIIGGIGFGCYFAFGLGYFETFGNTSQLNFGFFIPLSAGMAIIWTALGLFLFGSFFKKPIPLAIVWAPALALLLSIAISYLYAKSVLATPSDPDLLSKIATHLSLIGLLPTIGALILIPDGDGVGNWEELNESASENGANGSKENAARKAFDILLSDLILIEAADNYCKFTFLSNGQIKTKLLRMRMKEAEKELTGLVQFERCHRSFIVNIEMISGIEGNAQAYRLALFYLDDSIPVSRAYDVEPLRQKLGS